MTENLPQFLWPNEQWLRTGNARQCAQVAAVVLTAELCPPDYRVEMRVRATDTQITVFEDQLGTPGTTCVLMNFQESETDPTRPLIMTCITGHAHDRVIEAVGITMLRICGAKPVTLPVLTQIREIEPKVMSHADDR